MKWCCVHIQDFRLQYAIHRKFDGYEDGPLAVVKDERPQTKLIACSRKAKRMGVAVGISATEALARCEGLKVCVMRESDIAEAKQNIVSSLQTMSPEVEISQTHEGVFWLNASGLEGLFGSSTLWAHQLREMLRGLGWNATVVVGSHRLSTWALSCRPVQSVMVFDDVEEEQLQTGYVRLQDVLPLADRKLLDRLGVYTVADLMALSTADVKVRLGDEAARLQQLAKGMFAPLLPAAHAAPVEVSTWLEHPLNDSEALLHIVEAQLKQCVAQCVDQHVSIQSLTLRWVYETYHRMRLDDEVFTVAPAEPTRDVALLLDLCRLKMASIVTLKTSLKTLMRCDVSCEVIPVETEQLALITENQNVCKRDPKAAMRAVARVKALCGEDAVVKPAVGDGHLPERSVSWQAVTDIEPPLPVRDLNKPRNLVRRMWTRPKPMSMGRAGIKPLLKCALFSGGWWRKDTKREYFYVEYPDGDIRWVFFDWFQRRWFEHGRVT